MKVIESGDIKISFSQAPFQKIRVKTKTRNEVLLDPYITNSGMLYEIESKNLGGGLWELYAVNYHKKRKNGNR